MSLGRIAHYELLERVGEGGMGVVFRAFDTMLERHVALKLMSEELSRDPEFRARLLREARVEAALHHAHIATCHAIGEAPLEPADLLEPGSAGPHPDRVLYLDMEFVEGQDLETLIGLRPMKMTRVIELGIQIASALEAAHASGVVHRDLKPGNVRVMPDGTAKILDFGLARVRASEARAMGDVTSSFHTSRTRILGTAPYMSPEQAEGRPDVDGRSDLFSLGVVLYRLVTGRLPFDGRNPIEVLTAIANAEPQPLARYANDVPDELQRIVSKLLEKQPEDRYQSAHEVATDLRRLLTSLKTAAMPSPASLRRDGPTGPMPRPFGPGWWRLPESRPALAVGLAIAAVVVVFVWPRPPSRNVALLPFRNLTGDASLDYLGAGLSADLLTEFVQHTDLVVTVPRRDEVPPEPDVRRLARDLGVGCVVQGELQREPGGIRLHVRLEDGPTSRVRWAQGYDFSLESGRRIQQDIAQGVVSSLRRRLRGSEAIAAPVSAEAYEAYLQGLKWLSEPDEPKARDRALEAFERALALGPRNALALAGEVRALCWVYDRDHQPELLARAERASADAVRLDTTLVQARLARSLALRLTGHTREALAEVAVAERLNPGAEDVLREEGALYRKLGDYDRALACVRRLTELRPGYWRHWNELGNMALRNGKNMDARSAYQRAIAAAPDLNRPREGLATVEILEGNYRAAIETYKHLPQQVMDAALASNIATAYFFTNDLENARQYYLQAVSLEPRDAQLRANLGDCYQGLGHAAEARAQYVEAVRLTRESVGADPDDMRLRSQLILFLAKAGDCAGARAERDSAGAHMPDTDVEILRDLAKARAVCGDPRGAMVDIRRAVIGLGAPGRQFGDEPEFARLRTLPEFRRLVGGVSR